jgi:hypothetical protein
VCCDFERAAQAEVSQDAGGGAAKAKTEQGGCNVARVHAARGPAIAALLFACIAALCRRRRLTRALAVSLVLLVACSDRTPGARPQPPKPGTPARAEPLAPTHPHAMSLQPEMAALGAARYYREQGKPEQALAQLDVLARRYPDPALPAERAAERAATLCALGRLDEAKRFLADLTQLRAPPELIARANAACAPP